MSAPGICGWEREQATATAYGNSEMEGGYTSNSFTVLSHLYGGVVALANPVHQVALPPSRPVAERVMADLHFSARCKVVPAKNERVHAPQDNQQKRTARIHTCGCGLLDMPFLSYSGINALWFSCNTNEKRRIMCNTSRKGRARVTAQFPSPRPQD